MGSWMQGFMCRDKSATDQQNKLCAGGVMATRILPRIVADIGGWYDKRDMGSNPIPRSKNCAPIAQLDSASDFYSGG